MDLNLIVTILIAIIPLIVSLLSRREKRIVLFIKENIHLYKDLSSNIENLEISYNGSKIAEDLYLMKGFIFYIGDKDLEITETDKIYISVPKNSHLLNISIPKNFNNIDVESRIEENKVYIQPELIKHSEYIYVECLASVKTEQNIHSKTKFMDENFFLNDSPFVLNHRIKDVKSSNTLTLENYKGLRNFSIVLFLGAVVTFGASWICLFAFESEGMDFQRSFSVNDSTINVANYYSDAYLKSYQRDSLLIRKKYAIYSDLINNSVNAGAKKIEKYYENNKTDEEQFAAELIKVILKKQNLDFLNKRANRQRSAVDSLNKIRSGNYLLVQNKSDSVNKAADEIFAHKLFKISNYLRFFLGKQSQEYRVTGEIFVRYDVVNYAQINLYLAFFCFLMSILGYIFSLIFFSRQYRYRHISSKAIKLIKEGLS